MNTIQYCDILLISRYRRYRLKTISQQHWVRFVNTVLSGLLTQLNNVQVVAWVQSNVGLHTVYITVFYSEQQAWMKRKKKTLFLFCLGLGSD